MDNERLSRETWLNWFWANHKAILKGWVMPGTWPVLDNKLFFARESKHKPEGKNNLYLVVYAVTVYHYFQLRVYGGLEQWDMAFNKHLSYYYAIDEPYITEVLGDFFDYISLNMDRDHIKSSASLQANGELMRFDLQCHIKPRALSHLKDLPVIKNKLLAKGGNLLQKVNKDGSIAFTLLIKIFPLGGLGQGIRMNNSKTPPKSSSSRREQKRERQQAKRQQSAGSQGRYKQQGKAYQSKKQEHHSLSSIISHILEIYQPRIRINTVKIDDEIHSYSCPKLPKMSVILRLYFKYVFHYISDQAIEFIASIRYINPKSALLTFKLSGKVDEIMNEKGFVLLKKYVLLIYEDPTSYQLSGINSSAHVSGEL